MRHIIITGTSRGIGKQLLKKAIHNGHKVISLSRNQPIITEKSENYIHIPFDLSEHKDFDVLKQNIHSFFDDKVDIIINNAGYLVKKPFEEISSNDLQKLYEVNVFGPIKLIQLGLNFMQKNSHVVNVSTMGGVQGSVKFGGLAGYSSSKSSLINVTEVLAEEYKDSAISFNAIALGSVDTEMLQEAFPGYEAALSAQEAANYILDFSLTGNKYFNGKCIQLSKSTP